MFWRSQGGRCLGNPEISLRGGRLQCTLSKRMQNQLCMGNRVPLGKEAAAGGATTEDEEDPLRWECGERVPGRGNKRQEVGRSGYVKGGRETCSMEALSRDQEEIKLPR